MMLYRDRIDAGKQLVEALSAYLNHPQTSVIALPRGGVVLGFQVAKALHLPLDIVCPRKIGAPNNPELAIGAITETGEGILNHALILDIGVSEGYLKTAIEKETREAKHRIERYREGRPPRRLKDQQIILVDDGLATGSTMRAAIHSLRAEKCQKIIMAVPVAPPETLTRLKKEVDQVVCLASPSNFYAVGQFYEHFEQTTDEEVIRLIKESEIIHDLLS